MEAGTNVKLFEYSLSKPESLSEEMYRKQNSFANFPGLMQRNQKLIELITAYKVLCNDLKLDRAEADPVETSLLDNITETLFNTSQKMNLTPFSQYLMVQDLSYSMLKQKLKSEGITSKRKLMKQLLDRFIAERHSFYMTYGYSNSILQVLSDNYSHKRGSKGTEKICDQLDQVKLKPYKAGLDHDYYLMIDKQRSEFKKILRKNNIRFLWSKLKQNKLPDVLINKDGWLYLVEHKHMKEGGGGQDKQGTEIVDFIRHGESRVSFVTYLDGPYFNSLARPHDKLELVRNDILQALKSNPNNFFLNTSGFELFLKDVVLYRGSIS